MATPDEPTSPARKRRWCQFSLRTLLIVMLLASVGLSLSTWFINKLQRVKRQAEAVRAIEAVGGTVGYDYEFDQNGNRTGASPPGPDWMRKALGKDFFAKVVRVETRYPQMEQIGALPNLEILILSEAAVVDADLKILASLPRLRELYLDYTHVTDAGLENLAALSELQVLHLDGNRVTDAGLAHLARLTQLQRLHLDCFEITDAGLAHLSGLVKLRELDLTCATISDDGLTHLRDLKELEVLEIGLTRVTNEGLLHLATLPRLRELDAGCGATDWEVEQVLPKCKLRPHHKGSHAR